MIYSTLYAGKCEHLDQELGSEKFRVLIQNKLQVNIKGEAGGSTRYQIQSYKNTILFGICLIKIYIIMLFLYIIFYICNT